MPRKFFLSDNEDNMGSMLAILCVLKLLEKGIDVNDRAAPPDKQKRRKSAPERAVFHALRAAPDANRFRARHT